MTRHASILAMVVMIVVTAPGCAPRVARRSAKQVAWKLIEPPQAPDERYPRGYRVEYEAPLPAWTMAAEFATLEDCERGMRTRIDDTIDRARADSGAQEAKNDLDVRRAVHAQCVQAK
jgi:hypothetical protein